MKTDCQEMSPLKEEGKLITDDAEKTEILKRQLQSVFSTKEQFTEEELQQGAPA